MSDRVYLDHNATTPVDPRVVKAMLTVLEQDFGNPSSAHWFGQKAAAALEQARESVARLLNADPLEVIFTSGGTEANNLALRSIVLSETSRGKRVVTSTVEHPSVRATLRLLAQAGVELIEVGVDSGGRIDLEAMDRAIDDNTALVSVMAANNETGVIQPLLEIGRLARERGALVHADAVQWAGKLALDVKNWPVDLVSISSHKIYGPKGVGALWVRPGVKLTPLQTGGGQEKGIRCGTENLPGIAGFGAAAALAADELEARIEHSAALRDRLENALLAVPGAQVNGDRSHRVPNTTNISFPGAEGEAVLMTLDLKGVAISTGNACSSGHSEPSHVLTAMGLPYAESASALRLSVGKDNTKDQIDRAAQIIAEAVTRIRSISGR